VPGKLPALNASEAAAFLDRFAPRHVVRRNTVVGVNAAGRTCMPELEHSGGMRPDSVQEARHADALIVKTSGL